MSIQERKLGFIQEFLKIQKEEEIALFEKLLQKTSADILDNPITIEELHKRIDGQNSIVPEKLGF
ncbi:MAG TPA: hypothetical protein VFF21_09880 [Flavobacteriaceae bacterium]|nr:hypothetical protein [Flavobacteriaceae bacterium]